MDRTPRVRTRATWSDGENSNTLDRAGCHSLNQVIPVIVAEIGAQSVDIQDQSHGAAQQFSKHLSLSGERRETKQTNKK